MKKLLSLSICVVLTLINVCCLWALADDNCLSDDEFTVDHFEDLSNWGIYSPYANDRDPNYIPTPTFDGESCQTKMYWMLINNDYEYVEGTGKSIKITGNEFNVAVNLPTLKTNTEYTISFKYKPHPLSSVGIDSSYFTSRIIKKGTAFATDNIYPASYLAETEKATETADWKELSVSFKTDNTTDYMLEFRFNFGGGYMCFLDSFSLTTQSQSNATVTTSYNGKAALRTADQSSTAKNGLRIYNSISKQFLKNNTILEYGSIVCLEKMIGNSELTLDTQKAVKGIAYNSTSQSTPILYDETDEAYIFTAYLTNIPTARYGENYLVRSYAIDDKENVYYGDTVSVCVFDIAHAIDCGNTADGSAPTDADIAAFKAFAKYSGNYIAYDDWLIANGKTAGTLRNSAN